MLLQISFSPSITSSMFFFPVKPCHRLLAPKHVRHKLLSSLSVPSLSSLWWIFVCDHPASIVSHSVFYLTALNHNIECQEPDVSICTSAPSPSFRFLFLLCFHTKLTAVFWSVTSASQTKVQNCFISISLYLFALSCLTLTPQTLGMCVMVFLCV